MKMIRKKIKTVADLSGETYIVTGANSGLGYAISELLLAKNAHVIMLNRNKERTFAAINALKAKFSDAQISYYLFDQSDKDSINDVVATLVKDKVKFSGIVLNAGIYMPPRGAQNKDGLALTFAVNYYGNYLLLKALSEAKLLTKEKHVVFTTSLVAYRKINEKLLAKLISGVNISRHAQYRGAKTAINILALGLMAKSEVLPFKVEARTCLYHPGITRSNIAHTRFRFINLVIKAAMTVLFHKPEAAAQGALYALTTNDDLCDKVIIPSWPLEWRGLPKTKKVDIKLLNYLPLLIDQTNKL